MKHLQLSAKEAYFEKQSLLDILDDEQDVGDEASKAIEAALLESESIFGPKLVRQTSSFLGPTPKERQAEFEAYTDKQRIIARSNGQRLPRSSTAPETDLMRTFLVTKPRDAHHTESEAAKNATLKRVTSLPNLREEDAIPFYKRVGVIPRELKQGKNAKPANDIKIEPEHRRLFDGKIIYFHPNEDISMVRRTRIHKIIQLGAAWVTKWRDDITHIMVDDASTTYSQLLRHFNRAGFSERITLVKFDPYTPQCIQFGTLLDPNATRFMVKGAPQRSQPAQHISSPQLSTPTQTSLKIKPSRRPIAARGTQRTDSQPTEESVPASPPESGVNKIQADGETGTTSPFEDIVEDSFIMPSSGKTERGTVPPAAQFNDALTRAIQEAKALAHLPLDEEDDASSPTSSMLGDRNDSDGDDAISTPAPKPVRKYGFISKASALRDKKTLNLAHFQCMDPSASRSTSQNPNARTIQILEEMCKHYDQMNDRWRTLAYRKSITTLKKQSVKINTAEQAAALPFIGSRLADKIEEIVLTDRLRKLDNTRADPLDAVLRLFLCVYGAGLTQANKWIQAGYRTLNDLRTKAKLTDSHRVGVEHYQDFNARIPRTEVQAHAAIVQKSLRRINPRFEAIIMGSYRRGAMDSGDIDIIITCPGASLSVLQDTVFNTLVPTLYKSNFLKATLSSSHPISASPSSSGTKWHGASCLPHSTTWRRLDLLLVPENEMGAALIYFTGNDIFNRSMRLLARKKGVRLNQRGLYKDVARGKGGEKMGEGVLVEGADERRIFEVLGVPWREAWERTC